VRRSGRSSLTCARGFQKQSISTLANRTTPLQREINQQQKKLDTITAGDCQVKRKSAGQMSRAAYGFALRLQRGAMSA
jgi:hypothetical protein